MCLVKLADKACSVSSSSSKPVGVAFHTGAGDPVGKLRVAILRQTIHLLSVAVEVCVPEVGIAVEVEVPKSVPAFVEVMAFLRVSMIGEKRSDSHFPG